MFTSYPKIRRLPIYSVSYRKEVMDFNEVRDLFDGVVVVEEKVDGKQMYRDHDDVVVFYEYTEIRHQILYTSLPSYEIAFDVYDKKVKKFLDVKEKQEVLKTLGYCYAPIIYVDEIRYEEWLETITKLMRRKSLYGAELIEGVVVKNYGKQIFGKAINREFDEAIRDQIHYTRRRRIEKNKLYQGEKWLEICYPSYENRIDITK